jgi:hypothetical protein
VPSISFRAAVDVLFGPYLTISMQIAENFAAIAFEEVSDSVSHNSGIIALRVPSLCIGTRLGILEALLPGGLKPLLA